MNDIHKGIDNTDLAGLSLHRCVVILRFIGNADISASKSKYIKTRHQAMDILQEEGVK